ncbi:MAG: Lpg1974 family pore-forming outer membrane protein [Candidatus Algichlamydia australiensis]|nr:Lpg1974 family pore-forming outer membrane protein [Chlamydiales bacterium]
MKKGLLFLLFSAFLHAENAYNHCEPPSPPDPICETGGPSLLFCGSPLKEECWTFNLSGDFIYWTARVDGLGYTASKWRNALGEDPNRGSVKHPDFAFEPGFKVGLGIRIPHDAWEIESKYTWLHTGDKRSSTESPNSLTTSDGATWFMREGAPGSLLEPDFPLLLSARSRWDLHFNAIDLEFARTSRASRKLDLRPHFGFKGSWQKQHLLVAYEALPNVANNTFRRMTQQLDYWGFGIRTGFDAAFHLNRWFRLLGKAAVSGLWSEFDVERNDRFAPTDGSAPELSSFRTCNSFHTLVPVLELFLGLRWEKRFNENLYNYMMQLGWEHQVWWEMNQFYRVYEQGNQGDLTMQGLTFQLRLDF